MNKYPKCSDHDGKSLDFYCTSCKDIACSSCLLTQHREHSHSVVEASEVLSSHMTELRDLVEQANAHLEGAENIMDNMAGSVRTLRENKDRAEQRIRNYFSRMRNILVDREHHFINKLRQSTEEKKMAFGDTRKSVKDAMTGMIKCVKILADLSQREDDIIVLREERSVVSELNRLIEVMNEVKGTIEQDTSVTIPCLEDHNFEQVCRMVGDPHFRVCAPGCVNSPASIPVPSSPKNSPLDIPNDDQSSKPPPIPPRPVVKDRRAQTDPNETISLRSPDHPRSYSQLPNTNDDERVPIRRSESVSPPPPPIPPRSPRSTKELPSWLLEYQQQQKHQERDEDVKDDQLVNGHDESYKVTPSVGKPPIPKPRQKLLIKNQLSSPIGYIETDKEDDGRYQPFTKLSDTSNPVVNVNPPTPSTEVIGFPVVEITSRQLLGPNQQKGSVVYPCGVCIGSNKMLIVSDMKSGCVRMLTTTGKFLDYLGQEVQPVLSSPKTNRRDSSDSSFGEPTSVTVDNNGNIFVLDSNPPRILKYSNTGKFLCKLVPKGLRSVPMTTPRGLAVGHDGSIFVSDWSKSCILVFDSTGKYIKQFGGTNASSSQFIMQPTGIVVDNRGRVIVCDGMSHHIWIYTPDGVLLSHFGWQGNSPSDLYKPYGITVDSKCNIYISEDGNHRVSIFKDSGEFLKCIGGNGSEPGEFISPRHLCIDNDERLFVADEYNNRIQVFDIREFV